MDLALASFTASSCLFSCLRNTLSSGLTIDRLVNDIRESNDKADESDKALSLFSASSLLIDGVSVPNEDLGESI